MKKCLIIVDCQKDFVNGALGFPEARTILPQIAEKIRQYHAAGHEVIFTFDTHQANYPETQEGRLLPVPHCLEGTDGHALTAEIDCLRQDTDRCFYKNTFASDALYEYLKRTPYESIELAGVVSNICVLSNAVLAKTARPETPVLVDACCTAGNDPKLHTAALAVMTGLQIQVLNREESGE